MNGEQMIADRLALEERVMGDPSLAEYVQGLSPSEYQTFMDQLYADYEGRTAIASEGLARGTELANRPMPQGQMAGRVYVAPNPLEYLGTTLQNIQGQQQRNEALEKLEALSEQRTGGLRSTAGALFGRDPNNPGAGVRGSVPSAAPAVNAQVMGDFQPRATGLNFPQVGAPQMAAPSIPQAPQVDPSTTARLNAMERMMREEQDGY